MTILELSAPETKVEDAGASIAVHRQQIVEKACRVLGKDVSELRKHLSPAKAEHPWPELFGIIAHLLKYETGASDADIMLLIDCSFFDVDKLLGTMAKQLADGSRKEFLRMRLDYIAKEANKPPREEPPVPYRPVRRVPAKPTAESQAKRVAQKSRELPLRSLETITECITQVAKRRGVEMHDVLDDCNLSEVRRIRDVLTLLIVALTELNFDKISPLLGRSKNFISASSRRCLQRRESYLNLLCETCSSMDIDVALLMKWNGRRKRSRKK